jgi:hypothetical protein
MSDQQLRIKMLREVALRADNYYDRAEQLGQKAARALTHSKRSQISGLEAIANSALKTTDILDFIKIRAARQEKWRTNNWGAELLKYLSRDLREERKQICDTLGIEVNSKQGLDVHLMLIREFVRQLAAHYEYTCKILQPESEVD